MKNYREHTTGSQCYLRFARLGLGLLFPPLLCAVDGNIDLTPATQFIGSIIGALQGWFPWVLFGAFLVCICGAAISSRRRMEWVGGMVVVCALGLFYIIGKAYINKMTQSAF